MPSRTTDHVVGDNVSVGGVCSGSVTRNESPKGPRDRSPTGREFRLRNLPPWTAGMVLYRRFDGRFLYLLTRLLEGFKGRTVTVKLDGTTKMTIDDGPPSLTPKISPRTVRFKGIRREDGFAWLRIDMTPILNGGMGCPRS